MNKLDGDIAVERLSAAVGAFLDIMTQPEGEMVPVPERAPQPSLAERVKQNLKPSTDAAQGFAQEAKEAAEEAWKAADAAGSAVQVDVFTQSGTWTKPKGAKAVHMLIVAGGGGGGPGKVGAPGSNVNGGPGGGGGGMQSQLVPADQLGATAAVTVGRGGKGSSSTNGHTGHNSAVRTLHLHSQAITANGGRGGGSAAGDGGQGVLMGGDGGAGGIATYGSAGGRGSGGPTGGSGGGGIAAGVFKGGGNSAFPLSIGPTSYQSRPPGNRDGESGQDMAEDVQLRDFIPGLGAGGGASSVLGGGGTGGHAVFGGGGGGGGAAYSPHLPGAGGDGGDGLVIITTFI